MTAAGGRTARGWSPPAGTRLALYFAVHYLYPVMAVAALAATPETEVRNAPVAGVLGVHAAFTALTHVLCARRRDAAPGLLWTGIVADLIAISSLVAATGGPAGPLTFLFTIEALAAGILLASALGVRTLVCSTAAILLLDLFGGSVILGARDDLPRGLEAVVALWLVGGGASLFSAFNERELRRRNGELATIRRVALDIENTLSLERILEDLTRGVVEAFGFDGAAALTLEEGRLRCVSACGVTGARDRVIDVRGPLDRAIASGRAVTVTTEDARRDGALSDLLGARGYVAVPLAQEGILVATRSGRKGRAGAVRGHEIEALGGLAHHATLAIANARLHAHVARMAITDPLTGLANHGEFQRRLAEELGRLARYAGWRAPGRRVSLIMADIDHFKGCNDRFGHPAGDTILRGIGEILRATVRSFDVAARYGGEEFAIVLPETDAAGADAVAERLREAIASAAFEGPDGPMGVTVSIGIASAPEDGLAPAALVSAADAALYRSKSGGRDRVTHASASPVGMAGVVPLREATRRRRARVARPARGAARPAPERSSRPTRRTPPG